MPSSIQARSYALGLGLGPLEHFQKLAAREGKVTKGWGCLTRRFKRWKVKVKFLSRVQLFVTPRTIAYQASPSMGFSRQECWSGLPFPSPGDLPDPGIEPRSPLYHPSHQGRSQQIAENSSRDGNTRPPDLPPGKSVCRLRSNS